ncbi:OB-fold domain-containing protein, partial [Candidatus Gottesmanbacteria bacterium]|nr:OB-fold domain-containing protein [Candidatus Gottesmanbacteria bacterium]
SPVKVWRHQKEIASLLSQEGEIISFTLVRVPPQGYEGEAPYPVVLVELEKGKRLIAQLVDWQEKDLFVGRKVKVVYRRVRQPDLEGVIPYGIKLAPL